MALSSRDWALRKLSQAVGTLDWTGKHLQDIVDVYEPVHPELLEPLELGKTLIIEIQTLIERFKECL